MRAVVTGAAGFIGSHLVARLLVDGHEVVGIDALTENYAAVVKRRNLATALATDRFSLVEGDLLNIDLASVFDGADCVFHLAGEPGVRESWGLDFARYAERNIVATQRVLEATRVSPTQRLVLASSSSVYGRAPTEKLAETLPPKPISPYGVTKLAAEQLCFAYRQSYGLSVAVLRYFTTYGPRQRPDMAFSRFISALDAGQPLTVYGEGAQRRDFTFVEDVVAATVQAARAADAGELAINVGSGHPATVAEVIELLSELVGREPRIVFEPVPAGDPESTWADMSRAREVLDFEPAMDLAEGLRRQVEWQLFPS